MQNEEIKVAGMFSGIGGFRLGLERANIEGSRRQGQTNRKDFKNSRRIGSKPNERQTEFRCVWANDNDPSACRIYRYRFGYKELDKKDIAKVKTDNIPDHDLLTAGFPCQAFSVAGQRKGFSDARGTLFYHIARVAEAKRPRLLLLENVKGLLSAQGGYCFKRILETLAELGYLLEWQVLNSKHFGVPQNRERVFVVGHLRGERAKTIFPLEQTCDLSSEPSESKPKVGEASSTLEATYGKGKSFSNLISHSVRSGGRGSLDRHKWDVIVEHKKITERSGQFGSGFKDQEAFCVDSSVGRDQVLHSKKFKVRRLTPIECERLQGFPDGWTKGVSDTQRYKLLGNAVTVNVVEFLGRRLRECMVQ